MPSRTTANRTLVSLLGTLALLAGLLGCVDTVGPVLDGRAQDVGVNNGDANDPDDADALDANPGDTDTGDLDATNPRDTPDMRDTPDAADTPDTPDMPDMPDAGDLPDSDVPEDAGDHCDPAGQPMASICLRDLASTVLSATLTVCETSSFSQNFAVVSGRRDGDLTTAGTVNINGSLTVDGDLLAASETGLNVPAAIRVGGGLLAAGPIYAEGDVTVAGDMGVAGDVDVVGGDLVVGGTMTLPDDATITVSGARQVANVQRGEPAITQPECARPDLGALVQAAANNNDNDSILLDRRGQFPPEPSTLRLGCGLYFLERMPAPGDLRIEVTAPAVLVVAGDAFFDQNLVIDLHDGATLDFVVGTTLSVAGAFRTGAPGREEDLRVYVLGEGTVQLAATSFHGLLYAPGSLLALVASDPVITGGLHVRGFQTSWPISVGDGRPMELPPCR